MKKLATLAVFLSWVLLAQGARGATICVSPTGSGDGGPGSPMNLQAALDVARVNGEDDVLLLQGRPSRYVATSGAGFTYGSGDNDNHKLTIEGGWDETFTARTDNPSLTVLDGENARRVFDFAVTHAGKSLDVTVENLTVTHGYAVPGLEWELNGAGIRCYTDPALGAVAAATRLTVRGCRFVSNYTSLLAQGNGGGIATNGPVEVFESEFVSNITPRYGAGLYLVPPPDGDATVQALVEDCEFKDNQTNAGGGIGGASIYSAVALTVRRTLIEGRTNPEDCQGGSSVWSAAGGNLTVEGSEFRGIKAYSRGGGIRLTDSAATITNTLFVGNKAGACLNGIGGAIFMINEVNPPETVTVINCTFSGNRSLGEEFGQNRAGGHLANMGVNLTVANSVFADSEAGTEAVYGGYMTHANSCSFDTSLASMPGIFDEGGNLFETDPLFVVGDAYYHLQSGSPCVETGGNASVPVSLTADFEGDPRIFAYRGGASAVVDMGWDEYFAPDVVSVVRADPDPTALASVNFTVTFSGEVTGVDAGDFTLAVAGLTGAAVSGVSGAGATWTVAVATGTGSGTVRLDVVDDDSIVDVADNPLGGPGVGTGSFTGGETYTVNKPVTVTFRSAGAYDGWVLESSENSGVGGTANQTLAVLSAGDDAGNRQRVAILHFDTAGLPDDAVVTAATLSIRKQGFTGTNPFLTHGKLLADIRKGCFGAAGLAVSDFQAAATRKGVASFGKTPVANWYSAAVNSAGRAVVNRTGPTQFRLRFGTDDNNDRGEDCVRFSSGNAGAAARPQLTVTYTVP